MEGQLVAEQVAVRAAGVRATGDRRAVVRLQRLPAGRAAGVRSWFVGRWMKVRLVVSILGYNGWWVWSLSSPSVEYADWSGVNGK